MAYTLAQVAEIQNDPIVRSVVETMAASPLFDTLPFEFTTSSAISYARTASLGGADFRAINEGYDESTPTFTKHLVELKRLGGDSHVDRFHVRTDGNNVDDLIAVTMVAKAEATRREFVANLINGDGTGESFEGIETWVADEGNEVTGPEDSFGTTDDSRWDMFAAIDQLIGSVAGGPNALIMRSQTLGAFRTAAARLGQLQDVDSFGRRISTYAGIPLIDAGTDSQGAPIITSDDIYAVRFDANSGVHGVMVDPLEAYVVGEMEEKPSLVVRVDWYCTAVMKHPDAAAVLRATNEVP